jgi:hypothetical protein
MVIVVVLVTTRVEETTTTVMVEMGTSTTRGMTTTIMAIGITTIITPLELTAIAMATIMAETTMSPRRRTLVRWNAISVTRLGIMQIIAHRGRMKETSPIHSRKGMLITSMWRRFMMSPTPCMVCICLISFLHLFFSTLVHLIHSFISKAFVVKNKIPTKTIGCPIRVSSPGGELIVNAGCRNLVLEIGKHKFPANLIVLDSQGIDVIIGMDWMATFEGIIDCANKTITLTTPKKKRIHVRSTFELKGPKINSLKGVSLDEVPVVKEYPDVFPEELPGMPPDRDVEFIIDLLPGIGPIAKRQYKMDVTRVMAPEKTVAFS